MRSIVLCLGQNIKKLTAHVLSVRSLGQNMWHIMCTYDIICVHTYAETYMMHKTNKVLICSIYKDIGIYVQTYVGATYSFPSYRLQSYVH